MKGFGHGLLVIVIPQLMAAGALLFVSGGCSESSSVGTVIGSDAGRDAGGAALEPFSFFVTSLKAMQQLANDQAGFGGDLRFGETGPGAGLRGADKICAAIADVSMPGASNKGWRAYLSAAVGEDGKQVDAIDRVGAGPWYDRLGRLVASSKQDLLSVRPTGADAAIVNDLPNEDGVPNHQPELDQSPVDNHDILTGSNTQGQLYGATATCNDWTSALKDGSEGRPRVGHSWPRSGGPLEMPTGAGAGAPMPAAFGGAPAIAGAMSARMRQGPGASGGGAAGRMGLGFGAMFGGGGDMSSWMSSLDEAGCGAGVNLIEQGPPDARNPTVGSGGGYGGIYCFALVP